MANDFTQAGNFYSAVGGSVDMRRGVYTASISLGKLVGNDLAGPYLPLTLSYEPTNPIDQGFGAGWSLSWTVYDRNTRTLYLSTGETYKITDTGTSVTIRQQPLITTSFEQLGDDGYRVVHKSGEVTILSGKKYGSSLKVPIAHYTPLGLKLTFEWTDLGGSNPRIKSISDSYNDSNPLLSVDYNTPQLKTTIVLWKGTPHERMMVFQLTGGFVHHLSGLTISDQNWAFNYDETIGYLNKVTGPSGSVEEATYKAQGFATPACSGLGTLPQVTKVVQSPNAGQPSITTQYKYSNTNYLGGGNSGINQWKPDDDNLFLASVRSYTYWAQSILEDSTGAYTTITQNFNLFHLMYRQDTETNKNIQTETYEYGYADTNKAFEKQLPQYQFSTKKKLSFVAKDNTPSQQDQVTLTEYDEWGNLTSTTGPDGIVTTRTYYPADGDLPNCDKSPNPNKIIRFVKSETSTPPPDAYTSPTLRTDYTYIKLNTSDQDGQALGWAILPSTTSSFSGDTQLNVSTSEYIDQPSSVDHGRIKKVSEKVYVTNGNPASALAAGLPPSYFESSTTYSYVHDHSARTVEQTTLFETHDGLSVQTASTLSTCEGVILAETDALGIKSSYKYDSLVRLVESRSAVGSDFESAVAYSYASELVGSSKVKTPVAIADSGTGVLTKAWYDGLRRMIGQAKALKTSGTPNWEEGLRQDFDALGRIYQAHLFDSIPRTGSSAQAISNSNTFSYDDWGQIFKSQYTSGWKQQTQKMPVQRRIIDKIGSDSEGQRVLGFAASGLMTSAEIQDAAGKVVSTVECDYDGLRRLRKYTDRNKQVTLFDYDDRHRPVRITLSDGTIIDRQYASFTEHPLITQISINSTVVGTRSYDGLFRVQEETVGGRKQTYTYDETNPMPSSIIDASGQTTTYTYIAELSNAVKSVTSGESAQTFEYDTATGLLVNARQTADLGGLNIAMSYDGFGRLTKEVFGGPTGNLETAYTYSQEGRLLTYTDVGGDTATLSYDDYGRMTKIDDGITVFSLSYDSLSRVDGWKVTEPRSLETTLQYDQFHRETQRDIKTSDGMIIRVAQTYNNIGQVDSRTRSQFKADQPDNVEITTEHFRYDHRYRLQTYLQDGTARSTDAYGNKITFQTYDYDAFGNIISLKTQFTDFSYNNATFSFSSTDPCQLVSVTNTHPNYQPRMTLRYDACGRLVYDHNGMELQYDVFGRLQTLGEYRKPAQLVYVYDALNRLRTIAESKTTRDRYYLNDMLITERTTAGQASSFRRFLYANSGGLVAQRDGPTSISLLAVDASHSVLYNDIGEEYNYDPFGEAAPDSGTSVMRYNGQPIDGATEYYHLGNGYRAYSPVLKRFTSPDSWSPFGRGGLNSYNYAHNDPVNFSDPSGHVPATKWLSAVFDLALLGAALVTGGGAIAAAAAAEEVTGRMMARIFLTGVATVAAGSALGTEIASIAYYNSNTSKSNSLQEASAISSMVASIALVLPGFFRKKSVNNNFNNVSVGSPAYTETDPAALPPPPPVAREVINPVLPSYGDVAGPSDPKIAELRSKQRRIDNHSATNISDNRRDLPPVRPPKGPPPPPPFSPTAADSRGIGQTAGTSRSAQAQTGGPKPGRYEKNMAASHAPYCPLHPSNSPRSVTFQISDDEITDEDRYGDNWD